MGKSDIFEQSAIFHDAYINNVKTKVADKYQNKALLTAARGLQEEIYQKCDSDKTFLTGLPTPRLSPLQQPQEHTHGAADRYIHQLN